MNYAKIYDTIIERRKTDIPTGYVEEHHIVPRSLGGPDDKNNLVKLTAKEHFICHLLLTKMYKNGSNEYYKMCSAFLMMLIKGNKQERYISSRKYEKLKVEFSKRMAVLQSGKNNSQYGTKWIFNEILKECKKVAKDSILEDGWQNGRILDWSMYFNNKFCHLCKLNPPTNKNSKYCATCRKKLIVEWASKQTAIQIERGTYVPPAKYKNYIKIKKIYKCLTCNDIVENKNRNIKCCAQCKNDIKKIKNNIKKELFINLYKENKNITKTLNLMGYNNPGSSYYKWAKNIIENYEWGVV